MDDKEIKTMTLDLAKIISYLNELQKSNNQNYITTEGLALLEGVVLAGNGKVKTIDYSVYEKLKAENSKIFYHLSEEGENQRKLKEKIRNLKSKIPWWKK